MKIIEKLFISERSRGSSLTKKTYLNQGKVSNSCVVNLSNLLKPKRKLNLPY